MIVITTITVDGNNFFDDLSLASFVSPLAFVHVKTSCNNTFITIISITIFIGITWAL